MNKPQLDIAKLLSMPSFIPDDVVHEIVLALSQPTRLLPNNEIDDPEVRVVDRDLYRAARVCKLWSDVALALLWTEIVLSSLRHLCLPSPGRTLGGDSTADLSKLLSLETNFSDNFDHLTSLVDLHHLTFLSLHSNFTSSEPLLQEEGLFPHEPSSPWDVVASDLALVDSLSHFYQSSDFPALQTIILRHSLFGMEHRSSMDLGLVEHVRISRWKVVAHFGDEWVE
ncbi:hypothetical protein BDY24DRAFT_444856 [Mrakia frigida]|uniref:uncharacterized protein n=1 Tax=Mrakia frigida TaxID=29902 RepID=UPI003FCC0AE5